MRAAVSSMRVSTTLRAVKSMGLLTTSDSAFIISLTDAPSPLGPPVNTSCNWRRRSMRTVSPASTDDAAVAWRVSSSLWLRWMVCTSTPLPI